MRYLSLACIVVSRIAIAADITPDGVDSLATQLDGSGVLIGQAEVWRSGKHGYDDDSNSASNTVPAGVYFQTVPGMTSPNAFINNEHPTIVAQQMIGTLVSTLPGVSPAAQLHSLAIVDVDDDIAIATSLNRLATMNSGLVKAINMSFIGLAELSSSDGNSNFTQFVDWSARQHNVLYVAIWGNADHPEFRKPADNYNGITVAASEQVDGVYRKYSSFVNAVDTDFTDPLQIDILAPGREVLALHWDESFSAFDGTSFAAPTVVGTAALLQQYADGQISDGNPYFDFDSQRHQVMKSVIMNSADKLAGVHGSTRTVVDSLDDDWTQSEAYLSPFTVLDNELGVGHLNAKRAVQQLDGGEHDPGLVPKIGWDYHTIGTAFDQNEYIFDSPIGGGYLAATLVWDRQTIHTETCGDGIYCGADIFFTGSLEDRASNLDLYLMPAGSNDFNDAVAFSLSSDDTIEHIFTDQFAVGSWKLVVTNSNSLGTGEAVPYSLSWWFGNAPELGDYNRDGTLNQEDYDTWRQGFGSGRPAGTGADGNGDGTVNAADYIVWRKFAGTAGSSGSNPVPEPNFLLVIGISCVPLCNRFRRTPDRTNSMSRELVAMRANGGQKHSRQMVNFLV